MLISRIKKLEKSIPMNNRPLKEVSDAQLREDALTLRLYLHSIIEDKETAREYKELFIDSPTLFEMMTQTEKTDEEMLVLLVKQRDWEIKHAELQEMKEEDVAEQYETIIKKFKFFKKL
jgi:hypothetical protein